MKFFKEIFSLRSLINYKVNFGTREKTLVLWEKLWYYEKNYGTMEKKLWYDNEKHGTLSYYGKNYGTIVNYS